MKVLITGASAGIGRGLAECYAKDGHELIVTARTESDLHALKLDRESRFGIAVHVYVSDLGQPGAAEALADTVLAAHPNIHTLVNNAGVGTFGEFGDTPLTSITSMMRLNMEALVVLTHRLLPIITANKGVVVNLSSVAAFLPATMMTTYHATKAFVQSFSRGLNYELRKTGVTVIAICPGATTSRFQAQAGMEGIKLVNSPKLPTADEVARVSYRAINSRKAMYITGLFNRIQAHAARFTPTSVLLRITEALYRS
jgi:hypothetical protein